MSSQTYEEETTGWVDWGIFAAIMMILSGVLNALYGLFLHHPRVPLWSLTVIALDVLVIWALTAHGRELRPPR
jgi:hypothetical protein